MPFLRWPSPAFAWPSTVMTAPFVPNSFPDTKTLPNPVTGPAATVVTEAVLPVPPIPPPA